MKIMIRFDCNFGRIAQWVSAFSLGLLICSLSIWKSRMPGRGISSVTGLYWSLAKKGRMISRRKTGAEYKSDGECEVEK